jgi:hypothetical protein
MCHPYESPVSSIISYNLLKCDSIKCVIVLRCQATHLGKSPDHPKHSHGNSFDFSRGPIVVLHCISLLGKKKKRNIRLSVQCRLDRLVPSLPSKNSERMQRGHSSWRTSSLALHLLELFNHPKYSSSPRIAHDGVHILLFTTVNTILLQSPGRS